MRTIRSLLWIGSGRGLSRSGMTEAPELDVTWVPDLDDAALLPRMRFDGVLIELAEASQLAPALPLLERFCIRETIVAALTTKDEGSDEADATPEALLAEGIGAVLVVEQTSVGAGFVCEINETLDAIFERRRADTTTQLPAVSAAVEPPSFSAPADAESRFASRCEGMQQVDELVGIAASSPSTVLVTGETGVGKEIVARALHTRDPEPFVAINCAAFPETLLESELFGHAKGAFTGAEHAKLGLFEAAGRGTLFLDEVAETDLPLQAKLLRVLQEREIRPVGDNRPRPIHCRIVAATNRVLTEEVERGHFREDLFYRLNVFPIHVPPLRERRGDILPLAHHFLARHGPREGKTDCQLSLAAGHLLEAYHWPGNVRELENEILRALMLTPSRQLITPRQLSPKLVEILEPIAHGARPDETLREALERIEAWLLRRALANHGGRKTATARKLGLTREGLYKKLKRLGIE